MFSCHPFRAAAHALATSNGPEALVGTIWPWWCLNGLNSSKVLTNTVIAAPIFLLNLAFGSRIWGSRRRQRRIISGGSLR